MLRGRVALFAQGVCPQIRPPDPGGLASGLEGLVPRGRSPRCPLFLLVRSNQNPPTPLLYYLSEGRRSLPSHETRANRRR